MSERDTPFNREEVLKVLRFSQVPVNVFFTKVNGDEREMNCTLNETLLKANDAEYIATAGESSDYDQNQVRVFDLDVKQWRSFLLTNLIEFTVP